MRENNDFNHLDEPMDGGRFHDLVETAEHGSTAEERDAAIATLDEFDKELSRFVGVNEDPDQLLAYAGKSFRLINSERFPKLNLLNRRIDWDRNRYDRIAEILLFADQFFYDTDGDNVPEDGLAPASDAFSGYYMPDEPFTIQLGVGRIFKVVPARSFVDTDADQNNVPDYTENEATLIRLTTDNVPSLVYYVEHEELDENLEVKEDEFGNPLPVATIDCNGQFVGLNPGECDLVAKVPEDQKILVNGVRIPNDQLLTLHVIVTTDSVKNSEPYEAVDDEGNSTWDGYGDDNIVSVS